MNSSASPVDDDVAGEGMPVVNRNHASGIMDIIGRIWQNVFNPRRETDVRFILDQGMQSSSFPIQWQSHMGDTRLNLIDDEFYFYDRGPDEDEDGTTVRTFIAMGHDQPPRHLPPNVAHPATGFAIDFVPTISISWRHLNENSCCPICLEEFVLRMEVSETRCKHLFHTPCLVPWLKHHNTCPVCLLDLASPANRPRPYIVSPSPLPFGFFHPPPRVFLDLTSPANHPPPPSFPPPPRSWLLLFSLVFVLCL